MLADAAKRGEQSAYKYPSIMTRTGREREIGMGKRTGGVCQFILSALYLVLELFSFAPGRGDFGLHLFAAHIGHLDGLCTPEVINSKEKEKKGRQR